MFHFLTEERRGGEVAEMALEKEKKIAPLFIIYYLTILPCNHSEQMGCDDIELSRCWLLIIKLYKSMHIFS